MTRHFIVMGTIVILVLFLCTVHAMASCGHLGPCDRGSCHENTTCVCVPGWTGDLCNHCGGRLRLEELTGFIVDSPLDYDKWKTCTWIIDSGRPNASIVLQIHDFATECMWDHLYIFDGDSAESPLLAVFSGVWKEDNPSLTCTIPWSNLSSNTTNLANSTVPSRTAVSSFPAINTDNNTLPLTSTSSENATVSPLPTVIPASTISRLDDLGGLELVAHSGRVLLYFFSDAQYTVEGFNISYRIIICYDNCSGHGVCDNFTGICDCNDGWSGFDCSIYSLPCVAINCSSHGLFENSTCMCKCDDGFIGTDCSTNTAHAHWEIDLFTDVPGRASHSAVVYNDSIFVFGGYSFEQKGFSNFVRFDFSPSNWSSVESNSTIPEPVSRYGHAAVTYKVNRK